MKTNCTKCSAVFTDDNKLKGRNECRDCANKWRNQWNKDIGKTKPCACDNCGKLFFRHQRMISWCSDTCYILSHIQKTEDRDSCWIWKGYIGNDGYGVSKYNRKAHRISYEIFKGEIPEKIFVCHTCDIKSCVAPHHLFLGTTQDNIIDMYKKGKGNFRLCHDSIMRIRELYGKGDISQREIAEMFGVSRRTISHVTTGRSWSYIK